MTFELTYTPIVGNNLITNKTAVSLLQPVSVSADVITPLVFSDSAFLRAFPRYSVPPASPEKGCTNCGKRKADQARMQRFQQLLMTAPAEEIAQIKQYLGRESLVMNYTDPQTGKTEVITL